MGSTLNAIRLLVGQGFDVTFCRNQFDPTALDVRLAIDRPRPRDSTISFAREVLAHSADVDELIGESLIIRGANMTRGVDLPESVL